MSILDLYLFPLLMRMVNIRSISLYLGISGISPRGLHTLFKVSNITAFAFKYNLTCRQVLRMTMNSSLHSTMGILTLLGKSHVSIFKIQN